VQSQNYGRFVQAVTESLMDVCTFPFQIEPGDIVRFNNYTSSWSRNDEFTITNVEPAANVSGVTNYVYIDLDRPISTANIPSNKFTDGTITQYIVLKRIPDETNLIVNFELPTDNTQHSDLITIGNSVYYNRSTVLNPVGNQFGLVFPQYISGSIKQGAGNTIKSLKSQNLI
jgi:hypothetical protein